MGEALAIGGLFLDAVDEPGDGVMPFDGSVSKSKRHGPGGTGGAGELGKSPAGRTTDCRGPLTGGTSSRDGDAWRMRGGWGGHEGLPAGRERIHPRLIRWTARNAE
ncbi:MAG: hypothetical protein EOP84_01965 [Verrucomicrobiaceae bacterium]|nr:MAG: hypothetical protein EOP84_01965 [Verrucomicrobiaceae bacterium]